MTVERLASTSFKHREKALNISSGTTMEALCARQIQRQGITRFVHHYTVSFSFISLQSPLSVPRIPSVRAAQGAGLSSPAVPRANGSESVNGRKTDGNWSGFWL
ncbi:hypothetical protein Q8A67_018270 [Cirrhinus molitorella]|uniref:Uncharacterized protein n=1 Tax=Cirrhinus molitorella TaxID=172907 RepID=A0AA88PG16_9TELE|nr:hypothetical protein Q8A67_018270 [Cirrhinus molitorella]